MEKDIKFEAGDPVSYYHQGNKRLHGEDDNVSMGRDLAVNMKGTYIVGYNDFAYNKYRRRNENRYVIEHFHGWYPAHQQSSGLLNPDIIFANHSGHPTYLYSARRERGLLYLDMRYDFAFESELKLLRTQYRV